jgi:hypothetical protein
VPGAKSTHILYDGFGNPANLATATANPYYTRMASAVNATVLGDAMAQSPTFFTLSEIGGNDVLGYATTGGDGSDPITPSEGGPGVGFDETFEYLVTTLTSGGAKGVVTTVPSINSLPHFTTVPFNAIPLDAATVESLNLGFAEYNGGLQLIKGGLQQAGALSPELEAEIVARTIVFVVGQNAATIIDEDLTDYSQINPEFPVLPKYRQATDQDLLLLASSSILGEVDMDNVALLMGQGFTQEQAGQKSVNGLTFPLGDKWVLIPSEQDALTTATNAYNSTIEAVAAANNLAVLDLNAFLQEASTTGIEFDDYTLTTQLVFGGLISLDGIHLTARGNALMANKFLEAIDATYETNFIESGSVSKANEYGTNYSPAFR